MLKPFRSALSITLACSGLATLVGGCGLERPIEPQPLESVIDAWRQSVLAENSTRLQGEPLQVPTAELSGDFGRLDWPESIAAEANGTQGNEMIAVDLLAGGGQGRWGMAILGIYLPAFDDLEPGRRVRISGSDATLIGCTGEQLFMWDIDTSADVTTVDVEVDVADPTLAHLEFTGEFSDGSTLSGRFTIEHPAR